MSTTRIKSDVRYELKYLITREQQAAVQALLVERMMPDVHGDEHGNYAITSLYYDTPDYKAYWDKVEGHRFRRKVRVRVYGAQTVTLDTRCFLEIKQREQKVLQKKRVQLPYAEAIAFHELPERLNPRAGTKGDSAVVQEAAYLYGTLHLQPSCVVRYNRLAYNGNQQYPDLRVTFDTDLKCRIHDLTLLSTGYADDSYVLSPEWCVMEIKANQSIPYWLAQIVSQNCCTARRISKYCAALEHSPIILRPRYSAY